jgi:O-antigen/teichoic acid export membrane protein
MWCAATPQLQNVTGHFETRQLLHSSMPLFWIALMNLAMNKTATFMLGIWGTKADVGIFAIANRTAMLTSFIMLAVNSIAAPKFAALYKQGDMKTLDSTARNSTKLMTAMVSPLLLVFILFPEKVMKLFGPQFLEGATALMILSVGQLVNVIIGPVGYLLIMSGHEKSFRNNLFAFVSLNILLNFILIPKYGIIGTSIATTFSVVMMKIVAMILVYWKLSIVILPIPRRL